jgi:hypothetical protein
VNVIDGDHFEAIKIGSGGDVCVPNDRPTGSILPGVDQHCNPPTSCIEDFDLHMTSIWKFVGDRRRRVEWIWVILMQGILSGRGGPVKLRIADETMESIVG